MPQQKLEHYKLFPIIAWFITICFALFVIMLTIRVNNTAAELQQTSQNLGEQMRQVEEMFADKPNQNAE